MGFPLTYGRSSSTKRLSRLSSRLHPEPSKLQHPSPFRSPPRHPGTPSSRLYTSNSISVINRTLRRDIPRFNSMFSISRPLDVRFFFFFLSLLRTRARRSVIAGRAKAICPAVRSSIKPRFGKQRLDTAACLHGEFFRTSRFACAFETHVALVLTLGIPRRK